MKTRTNLVQPAFRRNIIAVLFLIMAIAAAPLTEAHAAAKKPTLSLTAVKSATSPACNKIKITWKAYSTKNITHYLLHYRIKTKTGPGKWIYIGKVGKDKTSYVHVSSKKFPIKPGATYQYAVRAYNLTHNVKGPYKIKTVIAHAHTYVKSTVKATCKKEGKIVTKCKFCGKVASTKKIAKTKHTWKVTKKATCTAGGTRTCSVCGATEGTPALGHAWTTTYEGSGYLCQCNDCGATFQQGDICPNWSLDTPGHDTYHTVTSQGTPVTTCSRCGARQ